MLRKSQNSFFGIPPRDLEEIIQNAHADWMTLQGKRIFISGGTGFFGKWLLASFLHANHILDLGLKLMVLSRHPGRFLEAYPSLCSYSELQFLEGHLVDFPIPTGTFDYLIHAATDSTALATLNEEEQRTRSIIEGTRRMLKLAKSCDVQRFLYISSGAVYGSNAAKLIGAREEEATLSETSYGIAKREAENLCLEAPLETITARAFAFLGPHLPLDAHYAAGNFLRDALGGGPILVRGDGTALRTYLYPTDLIIWLMGILARGKTATAYNVGSNEVVSTEELAHTIAQACDPSPEVVIQSDQPQGPQNIYLPDILRVRTELNLAVTVPLREAIARTLDFHRGISP